jgi:peptide/nickel transport system ATP-binding protein
MPPLLEIEDLNVHFVTYEGVVHALNGIDLRIAETEIVGLVGETGSGKSVLATAILNAVRFPGRIVRGSVRLEGREVLTMDERALRGVRGVQISMIGTNPRSKLNPLLRVGPQIADIIRAHENVEKDAALARAIDLMRTVGINDPHRRARAYPHELSGGMAQRILIAMALAGSPRLLIADEATNGLDVTVQRQVLDLIRDKVVERQSSALIITHDLGIVAQYCQRVAIIYAGQIVEEAAVGELFRNPRHPYTISSLASARAVSRQRVRLSLVGSRPDLRNLPCGCLLHPRCPFADERSRTVPPVMREFAAGHFVRCHRADEPLGEMVGAESA